MKLPRRRFLHLAAGAAALPTLSRIARAQTYPTRPVRIVVGFAAGGGADTSGRIMGQWLTERLGQQFIVEDRPGAGSNIATEAVVRAPPDGYTLLEVTVANAIGATLYDKLSFNFIRNIAPVAAISRGALVMVVNPSFPARTVREFIAYAKANPGKINMATSGSGTGPHIAGELFRMMAGIEMTQVPYRGGAPAITLAAKCRSFSVRFPNRSSKSRRVIYAPSRFRPRRDGKGSQTSRQWANSCRATKQAPFTGSARPRTRRSRSSGSSTRKSTRPLLTPR
jgi:tripartite-type tricarboxylate transporter receptor subunit TctC